tara:strand:+ start:1069 stop:1536 length:468 start_codon:yes stop_codon:yes gene_type:complete
MTDLFIISLFKFLLQKVFAKLKIKIDKIHILSTLIPLLVFLIVSYYFGKNLEYTILVSSIFLMGSYILVNVPGAYITSIRIKIFEIINENNVIKKNDFYLKYNDEILFNDRFERINKYNIIKKDNNKYYLISKKISFLIFFVEVMRTLFKKINRC